MLNQCVLTGNLGADPEVFYSPEGSAVTSFNIAFHSSKKNTGWIKIVCFQKLAEIASQYLHKGAKIAVIGTLDHQLQLSAARYSDIKSFLEYTDSFQDEMVNDMEGISLMTIHKAKGLEFPAVFLIGLVEGITPTKKGDIEEERRIVFVGISRAMKLLYVSYSHTYMGQTSKKSIFLDEIMGIEESE